MIDNMVMLDAFASMAMIVVFCIAFPRRVFHDQIVCFIVGVLRAVIICINRINPVIVILYRVLMVCHADFCRNVGEKKIRQMLLMVTFIIPVIHTSFFIVYKEKARFEIKR